MASHHPAWSFQPLKSGSALSACCMMGPKGIVHGLAPYGGQIGVSLGENGLGLAGVEDMADLVIG